MGLVFADGFDSYGASADLARNWTGAAVSNWTWNATAGRRGGGGLTYTSSGSVGLLTTPLNFINLGTGQALGCWFWMKVSAAPGVQINMLQLTTAGAVWQGGVAVTTSGVLRLTTSSATIATGGTNVCDNAYHWVELSISNSTGGSALQSCYVDGVVQWSGLTNNLDASAAVRYCILQSGNSGTWTFDDFIFADATVNQKPRASDVPIGQMIIATLRPASDYSVQFTPSSGSNHAALVNEVAADDDTTYIQDNISGHADLFNFGSLGFVPASILAVQFVSRAKNPSGGSQTFKHRCLSSSTTNDSAAITATASYVNNRTSYNQDPNTGATWTATNLANAKLGPVI